MASSIQTAVHPDEGYYMQQKAEMGSLSVSVTHASLSKRQIDYRMGGGGGLKGHTQPADRPASWLTTHTSGAHQRLNVLFPAQPLKLLLPVFFSCLAAKRSSIARCGSSFRCRQHKPFDRHFGPFRAGAGLPEETVLSSECIQYA